MFGAYGSGFVEALRDGAWDGDKASRVRRSWIYGDGTEHDTHED
jgi:hypothetical protein